MLPRYPIVQTRKVKYFNVPCAFDIETTSMSEGDTHFGFMYRWQFCIDTTVVFGTTWEEFLQLIHFIEAYVPSGVRLVIYSHNLQFEFLFASRFLEIEQVFARAEREVIYARTNGCIEWRCSYILSNKSLAKLCESTPNVLFNKQGNYDYKKVRTPFTPSTRLEDIYCYCDVRGLCECLWHYLEEDTLATIPLTSTGFVRRHMREIVLSNSNNWYLIKKTAIDEELYGLLKKASRGGNTASDAMYCNNILYGLDSFDLKSSYPAVQLTEKFPMSKFIPVRFRTWEKFNRIINEKAVIMHLSIWGVKSKNTRIIQYLDYAHCEHVVKKRIYNGRILSADYLEWTCTDIDFKIFKRNYDFEDVRVNKAYMSEYGYLPMEFRMGIRDMFVEKCDLEVSYKYEKHYELEYDYNKFKNLINGVFGMSMTDIARDEIVFDNFEWRSEKPDIGVALKKYYNNRKSFLAYQWGVWTTARARERLQDAIEAVGQEGIYCDTDSLKCFTGMDYVFEELNNRILEKNRTCGIDLDINIRGHHFDIGTWDKETKDNPYQKFITLGAKKYAYIDKKGLHITVAGLGKDIGRKWLENNGGIDNFKIGTVIPAGSSGRTTSWINDDDIHTITVNGDTFTTASNVCIEETSYTFGITDEMLEILIDEQTQKFLYYL